MEEKDLKERTKDFALRIVKLFGALPKSAEAQILRSGTSVGAQYREAQRAKSDADFISKIEGALQELEESTYWLELLAGADIFSSQRLQPLHQEAQEVTAILITIAKKVKDRTKK